MSFDYTKTDVNARYSFTGGKWSDMEITADEYIRMHMSASCLHYGIELFEGLKAFRGVDGKVRLFRVEDNARRLQSSAKRLCLPVPTVEMVVEACKEVVDGTSVSFRPTARELRFICVPSCSVRP